MQDWQNKGLLLLLSIFVLYVIIKAVSFFMLNKAGKDLKNIDLKKYKK